MRRGRIPAELWPLVSPVHLKGKSSISQKLGTGQTGTKSVWQDTMFFVFTYRT